MKITKLLFAVLCFVAVGHGQSSSPACQQRCSDDYAACLSNADQQLADCLANNGPCGKHECMQGCPNGQVMLCDPNYPKGIDQCNSDHDLAVSMCSMTYADCTNSCADPVLPGLARRKAPRFPSKAVGETTWARLMRNLSRPGKLAL